MSHVTMARDKLPQVSKEHGLRKCALRHHDQNYGYNCESQQGVNKDIEWIPAMEVEPAIWKVMSTLLFFGRLWRYRSWSVQETFVSRMPENILLI